MKNSKTLVIVLSVLGIMAICFATTGAIFASMYNKPMTLKINAEESMANVAVMLQRQADVVTNAQAGFAQISALDNAQVLAYVAEAKAIGGMLDPYCEDGECQLPEDPEERKQLLEAMANFDNSSRSFIAYVQTHAELRAADVFDDMMISIEGSANRVSTQRLIMNGQIADYKEHCVNFPGSFFCSMRGLTGNEFGFYEVEDSKQEAPTPGYPTPTLP